MSAEGMEYGAGDITVLEGREAVRKRPGMYVGSTRQRGLHHLVSEVVGRAVNEVLAGRAGSVDVTLLSDGGVRVADDGAGDGESHGAELEAELTSFGVGSGFSDRRTAVVGAFSVGLFVVNALSSRLTAEGTRWAKEYERGVEADPTAIAGAARGNGTTMSFWPDAEIFETTWCSFALLAERLRQLAFLNRGLTISLTDERPADGVRAVLFRFPDGIRDFVAALDAEAGGTTDLDVIGFEREDPRMAGTMEVALRWSDSPAPIRGFVNSIATREGSTHVDGFRAGVTAAVTAYARERAGAVAPDLDACADRIVEGLTAVVSVKLDQPELLGATRQLLGNAAVRICVEEAVREHLRDWFAAHPEQAARIVDDHVTRAARRD
ncbi:ATP-binding protein [Streptomyces sp. NPDC096057]|uniref:ATP-binding protein n=1 Tax=Streptomyces sp. NPDC096057 TaxID=3155543 RepID=UPI00332BE8FA